MRALGQIAAITLMNLRTIPQRLGSSFVAIVGIAGVVVVLVAVLSIAEGFRAAMVQAGSPSRALVMRAGSDSEMTSGLAGPETDIIKEAPGIRRDGQRPLANRLQALEDLDVGGRVAGVLRAASAPRWLSGHERGETSWPWSLGATAAVAALPLPRVMMA